MALKMEKGHKQGCRLSLEAGKGEGQILLSSFQEHSSVNSLILASSEV